MRKFFEPNTIEKKWYSFWCKNNYFRKTHSEDKFTILLPPPNITGNLHMGHAFQNTIIDILLRYNNLQGKDIFLQAGTDHAGIATQIIVERVFFSNKITKESFFTKKILSYWVLFSQQSIYRQIRLLGTCVNWDKLRFTLDDNYTKLVCLVFTQFYNEGIIYKDYKLVNWDPVLRTAISDLEVVSQERLGFLYYIRYYSIDFSRCIVIATTRPETIFGDVAIAVNPNDSRYTDIIGSFFYVPLLDRSIPVIIDANVDITFGSGCLKITPAHSFMDYEIGKKNNLSLINIFNENATLNENVPIKYRNLDRYKARDVVLTDLKVKNFFVKTEECVLNIPYGDRTNSQIEPYLTKQWFMFMDSVSKSALNVVSNKSIKFFPEQWCNVYLNWVSNIKEWCLSRQLWWGHRIPVWYDCSGNVFSGKTEEDVRVFHDLSNDVTLNQENAVLDTWFSSALWPFTLYNTCDMDNFKSFKETNILVTGFDIIFFWVVRMVIFCLFFTKKVPFKIVYIHGLIRDNEGKKMSKFKGNILDPLDLMYGVSLEELTRKRLFNVVEAEAKENIKNQTKKNFKGGIKPYGSDALRLTFCSLASYSNFISFDLTKVTGFKNTLNKIWNAARCVILYTRTYKELFNVEHLRITDCFDLCIIAEWENIKLLVEKNYNLFKFNVVATLLCDFIKIDYCHWYLETTKNIVFDFSSICFLSKKKQFVLLYIFEEFLRILHPITPFVTEEIWQKFSIYVKDTGVNSILCTKQPTFKNIVIQKETKQFAKWLKLFLTQIRSFRGSLGIKKNIILKLIVSDDKLEQYKFLNELNKNRDVIFTLCRLVFVKNKLISNYGLVHKVYVQNKIFFVI